MLSISKMPIVTFTQVNLEQENNDWCCKQYLFRDQGEHQLVTLDAPCVVIDITEPLSCELSLMTGSKVRTLLIRNIAVSECGVDVLISRTLAHVAVTKQKIRFQHKDNGAVLCYLGESKKCRLLIPPKTHVNFIVYNCTLDVSERLYSEHFQQVLSYFPKMLLNGLSVCYRCLEEQDFTLEFTSAYNSVQAMVHMHYCSKHRPYTSDDLLRHPRLTFLSEP